VVRIALGRVVDGPLDRAAEGHGAAHDLVGVPADADRRGDDRADRSAVDVAELGAVEGPDRLAVEGQLPAFVLVAHREYLLVVPGGSATLEPARDGIRDAAAHRRSDAHGTTSPFTPFAAATPTPRVASIAGGNLRT